jgi:hypothetical protein
MSYHASGIPTFRTGSIVTVPNDVRVSPRYGNGISATPYARTDRNGMSLGIVKDVIRSGKPRKPRKATAVRSVGSTLTLGVETRHEREARLARERRAAGIIGNVD